ncbi:MAG: molybdopterin-guanine dinucleotide biosynthesis protein B [Candidatus Bathyarchaeota archaeon]|nr:molybdopterin-guanine dinucleotide biosynthesis protein B [Candidatus Bathyarchaeota archaeon]
MKAIVVAVVGSKKSGKTTVIEALTRELVKKGYAVASVKHISESNFTIDSENKDSWRFAQAGANTIITVADKEVATIEKKNTENLSLGEILQKCKGSNVIFIEGLKKLVAKDKRVWKIVMAKSREEALEAQGRYHPILAFAGFPHAIKLDSEIPYVNALEKPRALRDLVENLLKPQRKP